MAEVHRLDGAKVEPDKTELNPELLAVFDEMRDLVASGRLTFVALVAKVDAGIWTRVKSASAGSYWESIGALECLKHDMIDGARED